MMRPGTNYVGSVFRLTINLHTSDCTDTDPAGLTLKTHDPYGAEKTYTLGVDADFYRLDEGDYYIDIKPDKSGRWHFRWESTGTGTSLVEEGTFLVQRSAFEDADPSYCGNGYY